MPAQLEKDIRANLKMRMINKATLNEKESIRQIAKLPISIFHTILTNFIC